MKSVPFFFVSLILTIQVLAQVSFGPEIGVNFGTYFVASSFSNNNYSPMGGGIRAGIKADIELYKQFHLRTGVLYVNNGYCPGGHLIGGAHTSLSIHTLEIPFHFVCKFKGKAIAAPYPGPYLGIGPYVGLNAGGRKFIPGGGVYPGLHNPDIYRPLKVGSTAGDDIKMLDAGISFTAGLQITKGLCMSVLFQRGMVNLQPVNDGSNAMKTCNLGFSMGYFFHHQPAVKKI